MAVEKIKSFAFANLIQMIIIKNLIYLIFLISGMVLCLALYHLGLTKNLVGVYCDIGSHLTIFSVIRTG